MKITKKSPDLNVYIWEGPTRTDAKRSLVEGNKQPNVGDSFGVQTNSGFLIVAYPEGKGNDDQGKEFAFEYWVDATLKSND